MDKLSLVTGWTKLIFGHVNECHRQDCFGQNHTLLLLLGSLSRLVVP
jgi:hypothetical protein